MAVTTPPGARRQPPLPVRSYGARFVAMMGSNSYSALAAYAAKGSRLEVDFSTPPASGDGSSSMMAAWGRVKRLFVRLAPAGSGTHLPNARRDGFLGPDGA